MYNSNSIKRRRETKTKGIELTCNESKLQRVAGFCGVSALEIGNRISSVDVALRQEFLSRARRVRRNVGEYLERERGTDSYPSAN